MNLKQYISTMIVATILCWVSWWFVIQNIDPFVAGTLGFVFFYISLFLALLGTISLLIFTGYRLVGDSDIPLFRHVQKSFRQAMVITAFIVLFLFLQGNSYLTMWNAMILTAIFVLYVSLSFSLRHKVAPRS